VLFRSGSQVATMSHTVYQTSSADDQIDPGPFLDNKDNIGFIYMRPTKHHCLKNLELILPEQPYLIGLLIQKWEMIWAKLFPLRLLLQLGAESHCYPYPLVSSKQRKAACGEMGNTIMNLLCDTRNFQYTLSQINGLVISIENNVTRIQIPQSQYDAIMKCILTSNDYVVSIASFEVNSECDSHLAAIENENSNAYTSRTMSKSQEASDDKASKAVGCAFVVFNGALKSSIAKLSIIEDGIMVQFDAETMARLKQSLKAMKPFQIECSKNTDERQNGDVVSVEWLKEDRFLNRNICSLIDGSSLCGVKSLRIKNSCEYMNEKKKVRWIEIFLNRVEENVDSANSESNFNLNRFAESCAKAFSVALIPIVEDVINETLLALSTKADKKHLTMSLLDSEMFKIALRVQVNRDFVGYVVGSYGLQIANAKYLANFDNELIALLYQANEYNVNINLEMIFLVLDRFNLNSD